MAYTLNKYRKENKNPLPKFKIDGVVITSCQFMHNEWWYIVDNSWECESALNRNGGDTKWHTRLKK